MLDAPDEAAKLLLILRVVSRSLALTLTGAGTPEKTALGGRLFLSLAVGVLVVPPGLRIFRRGGKLLAFRVSAERFPPERERRHHALGHVASLRSGLRITPESVAVGVVLSGVPVVAVG